MHRRTGHRERITDWRIVLAAFALAAGASGAMLGAALGAGGAAIDAALSPAASARLYVIGGSVVAAIGIADLAGRLGNPPQRNRETPRRWVMRGAFQWALISGAVLGTGVASRLGFWGWYVVPAGAMIAGSAVAGAAVYGAYGVARGLGAGAILLAGRRHSVDRVSLWLFAHRQVGRRILAAQLLTLATAYVLVAAL